MTLLGLGKLALAFLRHPLGQLACAIVIFGSLALWHGESRYHDGQKAREAVWQAKLKADTEKARKTDAKNAQTSERIGSEVAQRQAEIRTVTQTLIREVPVYVPVDPARASLGVGFVRLHDAAALGLPVAPDPAGRADAEASGVDDVALAETVVGNYGACHAMMAQVEGWQAWARDVGLAK